MASRCHPPFKREPSWPSLLGLDALVQAPVMECRLHRIKIIKFLRDTEKLDHTILSRLSLRLYEVMREEATVEAIVDIAGYSLVAIVPNTR